VVHGARWVASGGFQGGCLHGAREVAYGGVHHVAGERLNIDLFMP
jgi:hypothetical protein